MEGSGLGRRHKVVPTLARQNLERPLPPDSAHDDRALAEAAAAGDVDAFTTLIRRHDDKMRGVVWRVVGSVPAMDDVLQNAYVKAWQGLGSWRGESTFSTWLYTIVHRSAIDWHRAQRSVAVLPDDTDLPTAGDHAGRIVEGHALRSALAELPPDQLAVVTLVDGEGRSYDEVAVMLDISPGTVASRLSRARADLRARLGGAS